MTSCTNSIELVQDELIASVLFSVRTEEIPSWPKVNNFHITNHQASRKYLDFVLDGVIYQFKGLDFRLVDCFSSVHLRVRGSVNFGSLRC